MNINTERIQDVVNFLRAKAGADDRERMRTNLARAFGVLDRNIELLTSAVKNVDATGEFVFEGTAAIRYAGTQYAQAVTRTIADKLGEYPSILDFGNAGAGNNDLPIVEKALSAMVNLNPSSRVLVLPGNKTYLFDGSLELTAEHEGITLLGHGPTTRIDRAPGTFAPLNKGTIDFDAGARRISIRDIGMDGGRTVAQTRLYSAFSDPMDSTFLQSPSVWIHGGCEHIRIDGCEFTHGNSYNVLVDARNSDIKHVHVTNNLFKNNRAWTFGNTVADSGSWIGPVHYQGGTGMVYGLYVMFNQFLRNSGNCVWGHLYSFSKLHSNIQVISNYFEDCGLDAILTGGLLLSSVIGNVIRRVGYVCDSDAAAPVPRYQIGRYGVGIDTSGLAKNCALNGNLVTSCLAGAMDLDGLALSTVTGNVLRLPDNTEPEYSEDNIATVLGQAGCYGIQPSDTSNVGGGDDLVITNNIITGMNLGAIRLFNSVRNRVAGNIIRSPAIPAYAPIIVCNMGAGQRSYDNTIEDNLIYWEAPSPAGAIQELDDLGGGAIPWSGEKNQVRNNRIINSNGNVFEFYRSPTSGSSSDVRVPTSYPAAPTRCDFIIRADGHGGSLALNFITDRGVVEGEVTRGKLILTNCLYNSSQNGSADSGALTTGNRLTVGVPDCVATGYVFADGFLAIRGKTASGSTYSDARANLFNADWMIFRFDEATDVAQVSVTTAAGARVWVTLGSGSGSVPGSNTQVIFNDSGAFGADSGMTFDKTLNQLVVTNSSGQAGVVVSGGYFQSSQGLLSLHTAADTVNIPNGGVTANVLVSNNALLMQHEGSPVTPPAGYGGLICVSGTTWAVWNGSAWTNFTMGGGGGGGVTSVFGTLNEVEVSASTGAVTIGVPFTFNTGNVLASSSFGIGSGGFGTTVVDSSRNFFGVQATFSGLMSSGGVLSSGAVISTPGYYVGTLFSSTQVINGSGVFVGPGVSCPSNGVTARAFNPFYLGVQYTGADIPGGISVRRGDDTGAGLIVVIGGSVIGVSGL